MIKRPILHLVYLLSGFAALGFQLLWTRLFAIGIGHELGSVLAVITAFFGGLTLGAWWLDTPIARSRHPGYWYAALEASIGLWGAISVFAIPVANRLIFRWTGMDSPDLWRWAICFLVPFLTLLPATFCMGGTLPAMERAVAEFTANDRPVAGLYSANTLGAVLGIFAAVFLVSPHLGFRATVLMNTGIAFICALSAFGLERSIDSGREPVEGTVLPRLRLNGTVATLFCTGLLGIGYEIAVTRALSQYFEDSVYTYASMLMVYLLGTSSGAFLYKRFSPHPDSRSALPVLLTGLVFLCLAGTALIAVVTPVDKAVWEGLGKTRFAHFAAETAAAALLFFLPTVCMGATFSHLATDAKKQNLGLGRALAVNTLGGTLAPFLFGIGLVPWVGIRATLIGISLGYCVLIRPFRALARACAVALLPLAAAVFVPLRLVTVPEGTQVLAYREGAMASVAVLEDGNGARQLKVDNRLNMGGTQFLPSERLKTHLPLLLHPHPEKALFIGLGTGITFGTVADYRSITADGVELDPEVVRMLPYFAPYNRYPFGDRIRVYAADARRFARATANTYDMILADFFHPYRDGAASLYTSEHFRALKSRLNPGGIFCQWLPLYQLDPLSLRIIIRTFLEVYPHAEGYLGAFNAMTPGLALIGSERKREYPPGWFAKRAADPQLRELLSQEAISDDFRVASFFLASRNDLERYAGDAPINTDDQPRVMFINPGFSGLLDFTPYGRLETLLDVCKHEPRDLAGEAQDSVSRKYREELGKVLAARDLYLRGAIADAGGDRERAVSFYLESAGLTPFFTVGYAQCLTMAIERQPDDPAWARDILHKLAERRPEIEDARAVLRDLFDE